jgi:Zn-dependent protease with chaperone function
MEIKHFYLGAGESSRLTKIFRIIFGVVCIVVAVFWLIFNINSVKSDGMLWITIVFLSGFGFYQIWSGLGLATRFIEIAPENIRLKKTSFLPPVLIAVADLERIEIFPLNVIFYLKTSKKILLRFGTTYHEVNEKVLDEIIRFAERNKIPMEIIEEKI